MRGAQRWCLIDNDPALLAAGRDRLRHWAAQTGLSATTAKPPLCLTGPGQRYRINQQQLDLNALPAALFNADLITASALLDLASQAWLRRLANGAAASSAALYLVLSYSGGLRWSPRDPLDPSLCDWFNQHQRRNKGLGGTASSSALGPRAADYLIGRLRRRGYRVAVAASPWRLGPDQAALQDAMLVGVAQAATEQTPAAASAIDAWLRRRRQWLSVTRAHLTVSHVDLFAHR